MGDIADSHLEDYWLQDPDGMDDYYSKEHSVRIRTCRHCGKTDLHWDLSADGKWRLYTKRNKLHACKVRPLPKPLKLRVVKDPIEKAFRAGYDAGYKAAMDQACPEVGPGGRKVTIGELYKEYRQ